MTDAERRVSRRLTVDFAGWLGLPQKREERFFRDGLIVLDANVLLDMYRLTPNARTQVLEVFGLIVERLWVPNQAAVEFSRNRKGAVVSRLASFKDVKRTLRGALEDAVGNLESAVDALLALRDHTGTTRSWDHVAESLGREDFLRRLDGVMDPALAELAALEAEHDLQPEDVQQIDPVLSRIDELLAGRIGEPFQIEILRSIVDEANGFRFPNKIPPGYSDVQKKSTELGAAGDYILWRQIIERAKSISTTEKFIVLITKDSTPDWWDIDNKGCVHGPRPELVQELRDAAGADLMLLSLKQFLSGAKVHLAYEVSDQTLVQLKEVEEEVEAEVGSLLPSVFQDSPSRPNLLDLDYQALERLVAYLLVRMGYRLIERDSRSPNYRRFDLVVGETRDNGAEFKIGVEVKKYRAISGRDIFQVIEMLSDSGLDEVWLIVIGSVSERVLKIADHEGVEVIDGATLIKMLSNYGIDATIE